MDPEVCAQHTILLHFIPVEASRRGMELQIEANDCENSPHPNAHCLLTPKKSRMCCSHVYDNAREEMSSMIDLVKLL